MKTTFGTEHEASVIYTNSPGHCTDEVCADPLNPNPPHPHCFLPKPAPDTVYLKTTENSCEVLHSW